MLFFHVDSKLKHHFRILLKNVFSFSSNSFIWPIKMLSHAIHLSADEKHFKRLFRHKWICNTCSETRTCLSASAPLLTMRRFKTSSYHKDYHNSSTRYSLLHCNLYPKSYHNTCNCMFSLNLIVYLILHNCYSTLTLNKCYLYFQSIKSINSNKKYKQYSVLRLREHMIHIVHTLILKVV